MLISPAFWPYFEVRLPWLHSPVRPATAFTGQIDGGGGMLDLAIGNGNAGTLARISAIGITNCWLTAESYLEAPGHLPTA